MVISVRSMGVCLGLGIYALASGAWAASLQTVSGFSNPGALTMQKYIPDGMPAQAPLVVVLHGCQQDGPEYYEKTGWKKMADQFKFALLLPTQPSSNNMGKCFNWFEPGDITRGQGEGASIINALNKVAADHVIDTKRVFVTGVSGGGAMTVAMLAAYPDRFAGGAIHAGVYFGCATSSNAGFQCMSNAGNESAQSMGDKVRKVGSAHAGAGWPSIQVWHGSSDQLVTPGQLGALMKQWTNVHGVDQVADEVASGGDASIKRYRNAQGKTVVETYELAGMSHGVTVNPGSAPDECGQTASYYFDKNVCHAFVSGKFWGIIASGDDGFAGDTGSTTTSTTAVSSTTTTSAVATTNTVATTTSTTVSGSCFKASNLTHVAAGRAYALWGYAYAMGSKQKLGLYNAMVSSKLRQTKAAYYVIDSTCP